MWILESEGDLFQGRRMWLKPGKKYLFGRVKRDGVLYALDHKTISRKHFIIAVDDVKTGDSARIHARSKVTIEDLDSKHGTYIDGVLLKANSRDLSAQKHTVRPGAFPSELVIKWVPINLTFQLTKKEIKAGTLQAKTERLESFDVKVSSDYISDITTHVIAGKRNTVKGLQALIQGKFLVGDSFVDSLVYAAASADLGEDENLSPLEQDFDKGWPQEKDKLAPPGKEPTERPESMYSPDLRRGNIFENFQFVFLDKAQYDNLLPAITTGQGKALHHELHTGDTTADELVRYMRNAAGKKGFGDADEDSPKGGAVMVRPERHDDHEEWTGSLINEVALKLDQRAIQQAEFLDAILATDASLLRKSLAFESTMDGRRPPTATPVESFAQIQLPAKRQISHSRQAHPSQEVQVQSSHPAPDKSATSVTPATMETQRIPSSAPEPTSQSQPAIAQEPPRKKPRLRHIPVTRLKIFDDDFDENAIPSYTQEDFPEGLQSQADRNAVTGRSREQSMDVSVKEESTSTRKRRHSPDRTLTQKDEEEEDLMEDMAPAAAAMRRQLAGLPASRDSVPPPTAVKKKRKETEIDVRGAARAQRQAEEEAAKKEREAAAEALALEDHSGKPANLVVIEQMPLRTRPPTAVTRGSGDVSDRWDPRWNGRKNFKKFRRPGTGDRTERKRRVQGVIVALVEVKTGTFSGGDQYWDSGPKSKKQSGMSQSQSQSQSQRRRATQTTSQTVSATSGVVDVSSGIESDGEQQTSPQLNRLQAEAESIMDHAIDPESPRRTRLADKTHAANARSSQKRPASKSGATGKEKRQKTIPTSRDRGDESDSDGMKFKFGRRKK